MSSFFNKLKPGVTASNTANNVSPNKKKDEVAPELTPLEKMLQNAGPIRDDGTDKFLGLENFGNTCYCNSIVQALYFSEVFRENVIRFPPFSPSGTPNGQSRKVNVRIRPPINPAATGTGAATSPAAAAAAGAVGAAANKKAQRPATTPGQLPIGPQPVRPEDKPDSPEYKKKQAMIKGPVLELAQASSGAWGMEECTFTGLKDIFTAFIESNSRTGVLSPLRFLELFRQANESFKTAMHQDAHEFYGLVLNDVIKDVEAASRRLREREELQGQEGLKQSVEAALGSGALAAYDGTSTPGSGWVHDIFEGVLTSETRCLTCETSSQRDETFLDLSIDLEEHSSVTSCLRKFSAEEMLCERDKFHCDNCGGLQEAEKRMKIKRLPKILALHLKRFKYAENYTKLEKLFHRVVYPYQLRMFNTTDDAQDPDRLYELYAVVVHIGGNAYHGHYVAVIKTKERGWLLFDDEMVEPVDKHYVRNFFGDKPGTACAYVLFYQETTFEKVQAEQEAEGLEEIKLASQSAGLALSPEGSHSNVNGEHLSRLTTQPVLHAVEDHDELVGLEHAQTAPGAVHTPNPSTPTAPPMPVLPVVPAVSAMPTSPVSAAAPAAAITSPVSPTFAERAAAAKAEAARLKEERERHKKEAKAEAKAAEKARKLQEKENAKEIERLRREREAQRKAEAEELRRVIAASKHTAAEEKEARKHSLEGSSSGSPSTPTGTSGTSSTPGMTGTIGTMGTIGHKGFLSRTGRGSKSMSRKSFSFLGKDRDKVEASLTAEHNGSNGTVNGTGKTGAHHYHLKHHQPAVPPLPTTEELAHVQAKPAPEAQPPLQQHPLPPSSPPPPPAGQPQRAQTHHLHYLHKAHSEKPLKDRFSFSLGRKKSNAFFP